MASVDYTGIHRHGAGWRAVVSLGRRGKLMQYFPKGTDIRAMQDWRKDEQAKARLTRGRAPKGSFEADVARYLLLVKGLTTIADRKRDMARWVTLFGRRRRDTITSGEIRAIRDTWLRAPRAPGLPPLAANTVSKRLRALSNLYTVLDGPRADNPVRDVEEPREPEPQARAMPAEMIAAILADLPDHGRAAKGKKRPTFSATKIRIQCMAACQITPKQLGQLTRADLDLAGQRIHLPARAKGRGAAAVWVGLLPDAVTAFTEFDARNLYGPFSQHSLRQSWARAVKRLKLPRVTPYQLRHTMGRLIYRATGDRGAVQKMLQHASWETSERYIGEAADEVLATQWEAVKAHAAGRGQQSGTTFEGNKGNTEETLGHSSDGSDRATQAESGNKSLKP